MSAVDRRQLYEWCKIPVQDLAGHPGLRVPFRLVRDAADMGQQMARDLIDVIVANNAHGRETRAIVPCGPTGWYAPFTEMVNRQAVALKRLVVFHMDESLDWQGRLLPHNHPYNFRTFMERHFYDPIAGHMAVPQEQRFWLTPSTMETVARAIREAPIDITVGGWGQDGHVAYNQARRHPYSSVTLEDLATSTIRIQENNLDTVIAIAQRTLGCAYQFAPPMSVTLGMSECLSAAKVRVYSDTGRGSRRRCALPSSLIPRLNTR